MSLRYKHEDLVDWPPWVPGAFAVLALTVGVAVIVQRQAEGEGLVRAGTFAGLVLLPFVLEVVSALTRIPLALPKVLFPVPVMAGMAVLLVGSTDLDFAPFVLVLLCALMAAESEDRPLFGIGVTVASVAMMVAGDVFGDHDDSFIWSVGIVFGWFGGYSVETLSNQAIALKRANAELAESAAAEERQRIAREIHDVIAHSLSVTMLHVTAARMALERGREDDALEALREAESQGRTSLTEVRRTVGLLGSEASALGAPQPTVHDLAKLADDFRAAGVTVDLEVDAHADDIPAAASLNVYRIVQEALTNAVKHAPGSPVEVRVAVDDERLFLRVHNARVNGADPDAHGRGLGLKGMAERATLLGGTLQTETSDGWTITLTAPRPT